MTPPPSSDPQGVPRAALGKFSYAMLPWELGVITKLGAACGQVSHAGPALPVLLGKTDDGWAGRAGSGGGCPDECSLNGECVGGACACRPGWRGAACEALNLGVSVGLGRTVSRCTTARIHFIPDLLRYSVPPFLKR